MVTYGLGEDCILFGSSVSLFLLCSASYGSLARFKSMRFMLPVGSSTIIDAGGDMSDFQRIQRILEDVLIEEETTRQQA